jgi:hypothetical protein
MVGAICTWDVLSHPLITAHCFGWKTFFRALLAGQHKTFLSLLSETDKLCPANPEVAAILKECIDLELRAEHIYLTLAKATLDEPALTLFFTTLAQQEQDHADLLRLCAAASRRCGWRLDVLTAWRDDVARLDQLMYGAEIALSNVNDVDDAMRLVLTIETSEVNRVFLAAMDRSNSDFVKKLRPYRNAVAKHLNYVADQVARLTPHVWQEANAVASSCKCVA